MPKERVYSRFQLRRIGFSSKSYYCIIKRLPIGDFFIGRNVKPAKNFLHLPSTYVSRNHLKIICHKNGKIFLEDTSAKGTFINGVKCNNTSIELKENDRIGVGFPVNKINASSETFVYGFILEKKVIKQKLKNDMMEIDESGESAPKSQNFELSIMEDNPSDQVIPETNEEFNINEENLRSRELEYDDVIFLPIDDPKNPSLNKDDSGFSDSKLVQNQSRKTGEAKENPQSSTSNDTNEVSMVSVTYLEKLPPLNPPPMSNQFPFLNPAPSLPDIINTYQIDFLLKELVSCYNVDMLIDKLKEIKQNVSLLPKVNKNHDEEKGKTSDNEKSTCKSIKTISNDNTGNKLHRTLEEPKILHEICKNKANYIGNYIDFITKQT